MLCIPFNIRPVEGGAARAYQTDGYVYDGYVCCQVKLSEAERVVLRLPLGASGATEAVLTCQMLEKLALPLFRRMQRAVDEACWQVLPCRSHNAEVAAVLTEFLQPSVVLKCFGSIFHCIFDRPNLFHV